MTALSDTELSAVFAALADPTRRAIVARLAQGDCNVAELAKPFTLSAPAITKHLKVLESSGLISRSRVAQARPCHLQIERLRNATDWIAQHRQLWEARFDRLDAYLLQVQQAQQHEQVQRLQDAPFTIDNPSHPQEKP